MRAEALNRSVLGLPCTSRWPVPQDDRGRGSVLVGDVRGDPAGHITEALRVLCSRCDEQPSEDWEGDEGPDLVEGS